MADDSCKMEEFNYPNAAAVSSQNAPGATLDRLSQSPLTRRNRIQAAGAALTKAGKALQRINLGKLIDDMEHGQELADHLEELNKENEDEEVCNEMVRQAVERCKQEIKDHLDRFLELHLFDESSPTYEQWIQDVHPENVAPGILLPEMGLEVDGRFYVEESDHLILWNERAPPDRRVKARGYHGQPELDLLDHQKDPQPTSYESTKYQSDMAFIGQIEDNNLHFAHELSQQNQIDLLDI
jgi:hypothetical protein